MAGAAVLGRLSWKVCTVVGLRDETATARTIALQVPEWPGHVAGQRVDLRVTAADGYSAVRDYSIASAPRADGRIELSVERLPDGEVSPYLTQNLAIGDVLEVRGPIGGWFVWREGQVEPIQLIAGGSGIAPLMAMIRSRAAAPSTAPFRLLYSVRGPDRVWYGDELRALAADGIGITFVYTRTAPPDWSRPPGRIDATLLAEAAWASTFSPTCYVCGPTSFVEHVAELLVDAGHDPDRIRTERFGPTVSQRLALARSGDGRMCSTRTDRFTSVPDGRLQLPLPVRSDGYASRANQTKMVSVDSTVLLPPRSIRKRVGALRSTGTVSGLVAGEPLAPTCTDEREVMFGRQRSAVCSLLSRGSLRKHSHLLEEGVQSRVKTAQQR